MKTILLTSLFSFLIITVHGQTFKGSNANNPSERLNEQYCTGLFKSTEGTILDIQNDPSAAGYINILDWLNGRVPGMQVYTSRNGLRVPFIRGARARLFLNEMAIDPGFINTIPSAEIAIIKVIKPPFAGSFGNGSAIAIYTIQPSETEGE